MKNLLQFLLEWLPIILPIIKDMVVTAAAIIASYVGLKGLGAWRHQLKGNTEYKLAKELLKCVYELRVAIDTVRNPFMRYSEEPELPEENAKQLSPNKKRWHAVAQAYQKRWMLVSEAKSALDAIVLEAEVIWQRNIKEKTSALNPLIGELHWAVAEHLDATDPDGHYESPGAELANKIRHTIYAAPKEGNDDYKNQLEKVICDIEQELRPHITQNGYPLHTRRHQ